MKIFIAGPVAGVAELNFPAFQAQADRLRGEGFEVVLPFELTPAQNPNSIILDSSRCDIRELVLCDGIFMLYGWQRSTAAALQHHIAAALGMSIMFAPDRRVA